LCGATVVVISIFWRQIDFGWCHGHLSARKNVKIYAWTYISAFPAPRPRYFLHVMSVPASDVFSGPSAFFKGATMILYRHNNIEQYGIGKIVALLCC
jgi:hypothetical protein